LVLGLVSVGCRGRDENKQPGAIAQTEQAEPAKEAPAQEPGGAGLPDSGTNPESGMNKDDAQNLAPTDRDAVETHEGVGLTTPERSFNASSSAVVKVGGPRMAGLELPIVLVYRGEPVVPAAKRCVDFRCTSTSVRLR